MLLGPIIVMAVFLLGSSVTAAPTNTSSPAVDRDAAADDDPLEVSETGHSRRRRLWRRLLKQVSGVGLGGYGLGGGRLNFLSQIARFQNQNSLFTCGPHRGPTVDGGVGGGSYGTNVLHYPAHPIDGLSYGGYYTPSSVDYPVLSGQGGVSHASFGPWDRVSWGLFENYGLGGQDGLHFETVWL